MSNNNTYDFNEISGKMISVECVMSRTDIEYSPMTQEDFQDFIKTKLCHELIEELKRGKFIEFTKQDEPNHWGIKFRARMFVTPDDQVRILRQHNK